MPRPHLKLTLAHQTVSQDDSQIETPSTQVEPEHFMTYETGVKSRLGRWELEAAYFFTDFQDMIVHPPTGRTLNGAAEVTKQNAGEGYIQGVEWQTRWRPHEQLTALATFTWQEGEVDAYPGSNPAVKVRF